MIPAIPAILTIGCAIAVVLLIRAEAADDQRGKYIWKPTASACFVAIGALAMRGPCTAVTAALMAGLILGAIGDVALMLPGNRAFLGGLVAFLAGHLAYVVGFAGIVPIAGWTGGGLYAVAAALAVIAALVLRWLWPRLGSLRVPVIAYVAVITTMELGAIAVFATTGRIAAISDTTRTMLLGGATLFFLSDLAVARERFVAQDIWNKRWGLPTYYGGQLLIAWSLSTLW